MPPILLRVLRMGPVHVPMLEKTILLAPIHLLTRQIVPPLYQQSLT